MFKLFILVFLHLNIAACSIVYGADETVDTDTTNCVIISCKTLSRFSTNEIFVTPKAFPQFNSFFQDERFWTAKDTPFSSNALKISHPQLLLNSISSTSLDTHLKNMLLNKLVLNDVTRLSNQILKIYWLKNQSDFPISFSLVYSYDKTILRKALFSFLGIISTPDPRATEHEWSAQTFVKVFSHLCGSLNAGEEDAEFNLRMRQMVAITLGLSPLNYKKWFEKQYPTLAKYVKTCTLNNSNKPLAATFTLSLMHALVRKMHAPLAAQIAIDIPSQPSFSHTSTTNKQNEVQLDVVAILSPIPKRAITRRARATLSSLAFLEKYDSDSTKHNFGPYFDSSSFS